MDELTRFKKKAKSYRDALQNEPYARLLELYPIIWYLEKFHTAQGKRRSAIKIVDLMAGSGFLSENLYKLGYTNIHAIEFCVEMSQNAPAYYSKATLQNITSFDYLEGVLGNIKPDIIISLASFHHLIVYDENNDVDTQESINLQTNVVDICMRSLPEHGILIIADLIEDGVAETSLEPFKTSMKPIAKKLKKLGLNERVTDILARASSLHEASSNLHSELGGIGKSLRWFRTIVDKKTTVGHKDIAISQDFLQRVVNYRPTITKYVCPWVFSDQSHLSKFIFKKFGFEIKENGFEELSVEKVAELAKKELGIQVSHGQSFLGWSLGILLLGKHEPFSNDKRTTMYALYIFLMACVLGFTYLLRIATGIYVELSLKDIFLFLLTLPIGAIFGDWFASRKSQ